MWNEVTAQYQSACLTSIPRSADNSLTRSPPFLDNPVPSPLRSRQSRASWHAGEPQANHSQHMICGQPPRRIRCCIRGSISMQKHLSHSVFPASFGRHLKDDPSPIANSLSVTGWLIVGTSFIFTVFPTIDPRVSGWFAKDGIFLLVDNPFLRGLRDYSRLSAAVAVWSMLLLTALCIAFPRRPWLCAPHKPLFVLMSFLAGPVVIVEVLKFALGRARPRHLLEFGGTADFTPVWEFAAACSRNCSFPSGEAAGAAASLSLLIFVPKGYQLLAASIVTPVLVVVAMNRVAFGAHFLSDVVLAWLITLFIMLLIWRWMQDRSQLIDDHISGLLRQRRG